MPGPAELFDTLDAQEVRSGEDIWRLTVYSIREDAGRLWMQIGLSTESNGPLSLVIRASVTSQAAQILAGVEEWLARSDREMIRTIELE